MSYGNQVTEFEKGAKAAAEGKVEKNFRRAAHKTPMKQVNTYNLKPGDRFKRRGLGEEYTAEVTRVSDSSVWTRTLNEATAGRESLNTVNGYIRTGRWVKEAQ